ncbi:MAG: 3-methyl-2-oxobutanoate hydroxymethyltransferase [Candidatus Bipolaricaulia bacterium]
MAEDQEKITVLALQRMKEQGQKISMITAYDYPTALLVDRAGLELILVGDSVGNTVLGYESTIPVELEDIIHHAQPVMRAVKRAFVVGDMPFMSFNISPEEALRNAGRLMKEAQVDGVKLEGGAELADIVEKIVRRGGIPVMGHIGLTPQRASQLGGFRVQGKDKERARQLLEDAKCLEEAGIFALILECIPYQLAKLITERLTVPTIGIGAGPYCDGQVLVFHDLVGLSFKFSPKFVKRYLNLAEEIEQALRTYKAEIKEGKFPSIEAHSFTMNEEVLKELE